MCLPGSTEGPAGVQLADALESYWREAGIEIDETFEGGWLVRRPDFHVAQIQLLGLHRNAKKLAAIREWLGKSEVAQVRGKSAALRRELVRLTSSKDPSDSKMFLNVACGRVASSDLATVSAELDTRRWACTR